MKAILTKHLKNRVNVSRRKLLELIPEARGWDANHFWNCCSLEFYKATNELRQEGLIKSRIEGNDILYNWKRYNKKRQTK